MQGTKETVMASVMLRSNDHIKKSAPVAKIQALLCGKVKR